jgi:transcription elongation factor Elf1
MGTQPVPQQIMQKFNCPTCQTEVMGPQPMPRLFNAPETSILVYTHARLSKCAGCGQAYACMISGVDAEGKVCFTWVPIQTQQSAIAAPTDGNMKQALQTSELASKLKTN